MTDTKFSDWAVVTGDGLDGFEEIVYEKRRHLTLGGGGARVSMNKPDKMNAMTVATVDEMFRAFYDASHDPSIGVIVVAGRGKHFGAGGDVNWEYPTGKRSGQRFHIGHLATRPSRFT